MRLREIVSNSSWQKKNNGKTNLSARDTLHGFVVCVLVGVVEHFKRGWFQCISNLPVN
jgi:hypothetical protein